MKKYIMRNWIDRQKNDPFVTRRNKENRISRAYFKIEEIDHKFNLSRGTVLDLGAAPGGWSQYLCAKNNDVFAIDILDNMQLKSDNLKFFHWPIEKINEIEDLKKTFDLIVSDIAPNTSGNKMVDHFKILELAQLVFSVVLEKLGAKKDFVVKMFDGSDLQNFVKKLQKYFKKVYVFKPKSSRSESKELFIIGKEFKKIKIVSDKIK